MGFSGKVEAVAVYDSEETVKKDIFKPRLRAHRGQIHASLRKKRNRINRSIALNQEALSLGVSVEALVAKRAREASTLVNLTEKERFSRLAESFSHNRHSYW